MPLIEDKSRLPLPSFNNWKAAVAYLPQTDESGVASILAQTPTLLATANPTDLVECLERHDLPSLQRGYVLYLLLVLYLQTRDYANFLPLIEQYLSQIHDLPSLRLRQTLYEVGVQCFSERNDYLNMAKYAHYLIEVSKKLNDRFSIVKGSNALGVYHAIRGDYLEAFEILTNCLKLCDEAGFEDLKAKCLINLSNIFTSLYNYESAVEHLKNVVENFKNFISPKVLGILNYNLGCAYAELKRPDEAITYLEEGLKVGRELNDKAIISRISHELVGIYLAQGDSTKAFDFALAAKQILSDEINQLSYSEFHFANMAEIFLFQNHFQKAIEMAEQAVELCNARTNKKTLRRSLKVLASSYKSIENFEKAFDYLEQYTKANEELWLEIQKKQTIDLQIKYSIAQKEQEIKVLTEQMKMQALELQLKKELEAQNVELKVKNEELQQFTYAISHDLKEPLRMVASFAKLWYRKNKTQADKDDEEYFYYISTNAERMTVMLNGLLEYAMLDRKNIELTSINLNEIVQKVVEVLHLKIIETTAVVEIEELPTITSHETLIFQLFQNFISNALKFYKPDVPPIIQIKNLSTTDQTVIAIEDNGIGIAPEHKDAIFKIFKRLHRRDEYEGSGIGLALCQKIVHSLGGEIWLESELDIGTTFFFSLP